MSIKVLAVETSSNACSASLLVYEQENNQLFYFSKFEIAPQNHTELILPMLDQILAEAEISISDVDVLAFGRGPGSFTGVRIAASVIKAIAFAHDLPVVPVSSLAAMALYAYEAKKEQNVIVLTDARMKEVYLSMGTIVKSESAKSESNLLSIQVKEELLSPEEALVTVSSLLKENANNTYVATGNAWDIYQDKFTDLLNDRQLERLKDEYPNAKQIAYLGLIKYLEDDVDNAISALPVYLRNNVAKKSQVANTQQLNLQL